MDVWFTDRTKTNPLSRRAGKAYNPIVVIAFQQVGAFAGVR